MVSGNEGAVNAGTTPVCNIADPMGKHDTLAELFTRHYPCCFAKYFSWFARKPIQW